MLARRCLQRASTPRSYSKSPIHAPKLVETDAYGIPLKPTWSVYDLLSSYPTPTISSATLNHLHTLSALIPPEEGTPEHSTLKHEMGDLIKLVDAVKLVKSEVTDGVTVADGRVWAEGAGLPLSDAKDGEDNNVVGSGALLRHSACTSDGLYVVDADRTK